jgi:CDP-glucose 4,6-dehydratase
MRFLVTGHTGFKGSWLTVLLKNLGHEVCGISLDPEKVSLFHQARVERFLDLDFRIDILNSPELKQAVRRFNPEVIIHLAAQPLVRASYSDPVGTYKANVIGTLNVLEASREADDLKATLVITTDKVYKNKNQFVGYIETDELGGNDPYSSSKAAADIATQSWRASFGTSPISIARAGNVIGGGDWADYRLIPDAIRALRSGTNLKVRYPNSIRPWQHVLDCLNGYLKLVDAQLLKGVQGEWNFGPASNSEKTVSEMIRLLGLSWGKNLNIEFEDPENMEAGLLLLNSAYSRIELGWTEKLEIEETLNWTSLWYKDSNPDLITQSQVERFLSL